MLLLKTTARLESLTAGTARFYSWDQQHDKWLIRNGAVIRENTHNSFSSRLFLWPETDHRLEAKEIREGKKWKTAEEWKQGKLIFISARAIHIGYVREQIWVNRYDSLGKLIWLFHLNVTTTAPTVMFCKKSVQERRKKLPLYRKSSWEPRKIKLSNCIVLNRCN